MKNIQDSHQGRAMILQWRVSKYEAMLLYIRWQKWEIYIISAKLRKHKCFYKIVKDIVTLNIKFRIPFTLNQ